MVKNKKQSASIVECKSLNWMHLLGDLLKTHNNLYQQICSFENIYKAYLKARKGKRYHSDALKFFQFYEDNLINIRDRLLLKTYTTGKYKFLQFVNQKRDKLLLYNLKIE